MEVLGAIVLIASIAALFVFLRGRSQRARREGQNCTEATSGPGVVGAEKSTGDADDEPVELSEEESNRLAGQVQRIHLLCQIAECHLDDLTDDYERNKLSERIRMAEGMAEEITDPLYRGAALYSVVSLACRAGWEAMAREILETVTDPHMKEKIVEEIFRQDTEDRG